MGLCVSGSLERGTLKTATRGGQLQPPPCLEVKLCRAPPRETESTGPLAACEGHDIYTLSVSPSLSEWDSRGGPRVRVTAWVRWRENVQSRVRLWFLPSPHSHFSPAPSFLCLMCISKSIPIMLCSKLHMRPQVRSLWDICVSRGLANLWVVRESGIIAPYKCTATMDSPFQERFLCST